MSHSFVHPASFTATTTVDGDGATVITPTAVNRAGVDVFNASPTYGIFIRAVKRGASAPTMTSSAHASYYLPPYGDKHLSFKEPTDLYALNTSGDTTTSTVTVSELV